MPEIWTVAWNDIRKTFKNRSTYFIPVLVFLASITNITNYNNVIGVLNTQGASSQAIYEASRSFMNTFLYLWPLVYSLLASSIVSSILVLEKTGRNLEPLMVTPLSIKQIWAGKSLGMAVVSVIIGLSLSLLVLLVMNFGLIIPQTGAFVVPDALPIITAIIIAPVLVLGVMLIATYTQLIIANPRAARLIFVFIVVGLYIGILYITLTMKNVNYSPFIFLGLIVFVGVAVYFVSRSLTSEKVVLSSKG
jgi:ABC-type Na+ efflux pump permease subunit